MEMNVSFQNREVYQVGEGEKLMSKIAEKIHIFCHPIGVFNLDRHFYTHFLQLQYIRKDQR